MLNLDSEVMAVAHDQDHCYPTLSYCSQFTDIQSCKVDEGEVKTHIGTEPRPESEKEC